MSQSFSHAHSPLPLQSPARAVLPQPSPTLLLAPSTPRREPHRLQGFTLLGKELGVLPAEGQRLATHRGADLPGGLSSEPSAPQVLPGPQRPATNSQQSGGGGQREQPPSPQSRTSSQQAGGNKASQLPLPTHGIVPERGPSLCTSSLPLWGHSCGASAPWSHLLLKPLWAGEGSHSHNGPTVPGSCLPELGLLPIHPQVAPAGPKIRTTLLAGRARGGKTLPMRTGGNPQILAPNGTLPSVPPAIPAGSDWGWLLGSGLVKRRAILILLLPRGSREPRPGRAAGRGKDALPGCKLWEAAAG